MIYSLSGSFHDEVNNVAHIGGLAGGTILGYALSPSLLKPTRKQLNHISLAGISILILNLSFVVYIYIPDPIGE
ncbi:hypothetical protein [Xanthocytophaga agilis]|uniref:Peptidase S54 rhomboid domain-containing protein n=1 Tax=Xanthocytophaga agilis TaxID=3048010 RepID=A0AAE3R7R6_9BACT|nr:hypothetical protein [Xanthocytophaga agilis]MDJ1503112.1 hypothetical protein [Xanthocytophaga agilis]